MLRLFVDARCAGLFGFIELDRLFAACLLPPPLPPFPISVPSRPNGLGYEHDCGLLNLGER